MVVKLKSRRNSRKSCLSVGFGCGGIVVAVLVALGLVGSLFIDHDDEAKHTGDRVLERESAVVDGDIETAVFESVTDGDTIRTSLGPVRIIGVDTPERGECGYQEASTAIDKFLAPGDDVVLELPDGQNGVDRYDRLIRYVSTLEGVDIGLMQLEAGNAVARYDSVDGYPKHPRETAYHAAQTATLTLDGQVVTSQCAEQAAKLPEQQSSEASDEWWREYRSCSHLKKNDSGHPKGPFNRDDPAEAEIYQWFAFGTGYNGDGDGDGFACE